MGSNADRMLRLALHLALTTALVGAAAIPASAKAPENDAEKTFYYLGTLAAGSLERFHLNDEEVELVKQGMADALAGKAIELDGQAYGQRAQALLAERAQAALAVEKEASTKFLAQEAAKDGVRKLDSGVLIQDLVAGTGDSPTAESTVEVHYTGTLRDGTVFDSSVQRGQTFKTPLGRVVQCWQDGVAAMRVGGKSRLVCPPDLAYGDRGAGPGIPGGAALVFEVELISIVE